ncbi:MAG: DUF5671 domain-containing protein [Patescibacteria group bacterium]
MSKNNSAKFAFLYLLSLVALGFVAVDVGQVIFQFVNKYIVDTIGNNTGMFNQEMLKFAIAAIVIATPVYYLSTRFIYRSLYKGELDKESGVRKWLTYLIIFIAFLVMIGSLIGVLVMFLNGELSSRFILKALTTLVIAGIVFSFYFYDIRREKVEGHKDKLIRFYFYGSLCLVVAVFIASLTIVESPKLARSRQIDQRVTNNLSEIHYNLNNYYQTYKKLPADFQALRAEYKYLNDSLFENPSSQEVFKYQVKGDRDYELCATFLTDTTKIDPNKEAYYYYDARWVHASGYQCLSQKVEALAKDGTPIGNVPVPVK